MSRLSSELTRATCSLVGIIDVLQEWTWSKRLERFFKIWFRGRCADKNELSAVEPIPYKNRFNSFVNEIVMNLPEEESDKAGAVALSVNKRF